MIQRRSFRRGHSVVPSTSGYRDSAIDENKPEFFQMGFIRLACVLFEALPFADRMRGGSRRQKLQKNNRALKKIFDERFGEKRDFVPPFQKCQPNNRPGIFVFTSNFLISNQKAFCNLPRFRGNNLIQPLSMGDIIQPYDPAILRQLPAIVKAYQLPDTRKAVIQMLTSFGPFVAIWIAMYFLLDVSFWLVLPLAALNAFFLVRIFIIQHDCGHQSFTTSRKANDIIGQICSFMSFIPYRYWAKSHNFHHGHNGILWEHRILATSN
jgi:hypothetical protein